MIKYKLILSDSDLGLDAASVITDGLCPNPATFVELAHAAVNLLTLSCDLLPVAFNPERDPDAEPE